MKVSSFQFTEPLLIKADFEMLPIEDESESIANINLETNIVDVGGKNEAMVELTVRVNHDNQDSDQKGLFAAEVVMQSMFRWEEEGLSKEDVEQLLRINAPALLLSYVRPIIALLTSASPAPTYNIPFINMLPDDGKKSE